MGFTAFFGKTQQQCAIFQKRVCVRMAIDLITWHWLSFFILSLHTHFNPWCQVRETGSQDKLVFF